jgi:hypothetical protein
MMGTYKMQVMHKFVLVYCSRGCVIIRQMFQNIFGLLFLSILFLSILIYSYLFLSILGWHFGRKCFPTANQDNRL